MSSRPPKSSHSRKRFADYFPEEHIIVTSGLVLLGVAILAVAPAMQSIGYSTQLAFNSAPVTVGSFTYVDALFIGAGAFAIVFAAVYLSWKYAYPSHKSQIQK